MTLAVINCTPIVSEAQWHGLRAPNVGASEVAALLGVHEFVTGYGLAARKLGLLKDAGDNPVMKRGRLLEPVARALLAEQKPGWQQIPASAYYSDDALRFGCTPDLFVRDAERGLGVVQIKTVAPPIFATKWHNEGGNIEPPLWVAIQAMSEQHLTGAQFAVVAALVVGYGLSLELVDVPYLPNVIERLRQRVAEFWRMVDAGQLPEPDYGVDRDVLAQVLREDDGSEIDLTGDNELPEVAARLEAARHAKRLAEGTIDDCQARILHRLGTAQRARIAGGVITAKTIHRSEYIAKATSYRAVKTKLDRPAAARAAAE
jgi:hypothetical protein